MVALKHHLGYGLKVKGQSENEEKSNITPTIMVGKIKSQDKTFNFDISYEKVYVYSYLYRDINRIHQFRVIYPKGSISVNDI